MSQRSSAPARALAVSALAVGFIALVVVIASSTGGGSHRSSGHSHRGHVSRRASEPPHKTAASYVVQSGDTLTSIAQKTGVPVATIERLNPEVDPQILVSGERLKLR
jgi:LysM repeat protein